jgi:glycerophosphoryl diester phosphodiesterase
MGYHSRLPMDSEESIYNCLHSGADGSEMDLQMTEDSVLFLYHDVNLEDATTCSGRIDSEKASALSGCKYKKNGKRNGLTEASVFFARNPLPAGSLVTLECKLRNSDMHVFARALLALTKQYHLRERCLIETVEPEFLRILESADPSLQTYLYAQYPQAATSLRDSLVFDGLTISMDLINAAQIKEVHKKGLKVSIFSMATEQQNIEALEMSPDNIQTDKLEHLVEVYVKKRD